MATSNLSSASLKSQFANDPDMAELVELFVSELPGRVESIRKALGDQAFTDLRRMAHQLKGASGGYGYPTIGDAAGKLEQTIVAAGDQQAAKLDSIRAQVDELLALCNRALPRS